MNDQEIWNAVLGTQSTQDFVASLGGSVSLKDLKSFVKAKGTKFPADIKKQAEALRLVLAKDGFKLRA